MTGPTRRPHGVHTGAGDRVRPEFVPLPTEVDPAYVDKLWDAFIGSSSSNDPDLASRAKEIARVEMGARDGD